MVFLAYLRNNDPRQQRGPFWLGVMRNKLISQPDNLFRKSPCSSPSHLSWRVVQPISSSTSTSKQQKPKQQRRSKKCIAITTGGNSTNLTLQLHMKSHRRRNNLLERNANMKCYWGRQGISHCFWQARQAEILQKATDIRSIAACFLHQSQPKAAHNVARMNHDVPWTTGSPIQWLQDQPQLIDDVSALTTDDCV